MFSLGYIYLLFTLNMKAKQRKVKLLLKYEKINLK